MAKRISDEQIKFDLVVNGNKAQAELLETDKNIRKITEETKGLRLEKQKLEAQNKKGSDEWKAVNAALKKNSIALKEAKNKTAILRKEIGITALTPRQLRAELKKLKFAYDNSIPNSENQKRVRAQYKKIEQELKKVSLQAKKTGKNVNSSSQNMIRGLGNFATKATIAGAAIYTAFRTLKEGMDIAAEVESIDNKATVVLGDFKSQVEDVAATTANSLGLTKLEFVDATTAAADLLVPMKFTRKEAVNMSTELVSLSGALSEWTNGQFSSKEVSKILTKALLGEREQLKTLGISISENDVKTRLAEKGQSKLKGTMLQQAKASATLELITEKSTDAQTAFAKGAETLARKQSIAETKVREMRDELGKKLIPVYYKLIDLLVELNKHSGPVAKVWNDFIKTIGSLFSALGFLYNRITSGKKELSAASLIMKGFAKIIELSFLPLKKIVEAIDDLIRGSVKLYRGIKAVIPVIKKIIVDNFVGIKDIIAGAFTLDPAQIKRGFKRAAQSSASEAADAFTTAFNQSLEKKPAPNFNIGMFSSKSVTADAQTFLSAYKNGLKEVETETKKTNAVIDKASDKSTKKREENIQTVTAAQVKSLSDIDNLHEKIDANLLKISNDRTKSITQSIKDYQEQMKVFNEIGIQVGQILGDVLADQEADWSDFVKRSIIVLLDYLKKQVEAAILQATVYSLASPESVLSGGLAGAAKAALFTAAIEATFALFKANLTQHAKGRYNVIGADDGITYNNIPYIGKQSTGYLPSHPAIISETGQEAIISHRDLQNPIVSNLFNQIRSVVGVKQYADGNVNSVNTGSIDASAINEVLNEIRALRNDINNFEKIKEVVLYYSKLQDYADDLSNAKSNVNIV